MQHAKELPPTGYHLLLATAACLTVGGLESRLSAGVGRSSWKTRPSHCRIYHPTTTPPADMHVPRRLHVLAQEVFLHKSLPLDSFVCTGDQPAAAGSTTNPVTKSHGGHAPAAMQWLTRGADTLANNSQLLLHAQRQTWPCTHIQHLPFTHGPQAFQPQA